MVDFGLSWLDYLVGAQLVMTTSCSCIVVGGVSGVTIWMSTFSAFLQKNFLFLLSVPHPPLSLSVCPKQLKATEQKDSMKGGRDLWL